MGKERQTIPIYDPYPLRFESGDFMAFRVLKTEVFRWYAADQLSLRISGREIPLPRINPTFVKYVDPADSAKWSSYWVELTQDTERLATGDCLVVTLTDPRHFGPDGTT
jgi:hypothetical protein